MDLNVKGDEILIRKIEDIIDIQKASGNINVRQVAFNLPLETDRTMSASLAKSLETGLSKVKRERTKFKNKKIRSRQRKCSLPDVASWPSDSDITVLRMKLTLTKEIKKNKLGTVVSGDGLHQQDSSSMINLATLINKSQSPSKHSILEEYLLPLSSWELAGENETKVIRAHNETCDYLKNEYQVFDATSSHHGTEYFNSNNSDAEVVSTKSKVARFLRLYFCPCCTCLYKMEQLREEPSAYCTEK